MSSLAQEVHVRDHSSYDLIKILFQKENIQLPEAEGHQFNKLHLLCTCLLRGKTWPIIEEVKHHFTSLTQTLKPHDVCEWTLNALSRVALEGPSSAALMFAGAHTILPPKKISSYLLGNEGSRENDEGAFGAIYFWDAP